MYEVKTYLVPTIVRQLFTEVFNIHNHNTRQTYGFYVCKYRTNLGKFSIKIHGPLIWNIIPLYIQNVPTIHMFTKCLKQHILDDQ